MLRRHYDETLESYQLPQVVIVSFVARKVLASSTLVPIKLKKTY